MFGFIVAGATIATVKMIRSTGSPLFFGAVGPVATDSALTRVPPIGDRPVQMPDFLSETGQK
ncbi:hypothetical protein K227x_59730 [Rubripirellula lacrimiformis]|uniref:Uncharacterized protein n=1 Tax=Rubripirellula lacrimiformis TaxID=1930273 RepID=A0A517NK75_9BACT|nr:hypothetical protein K227x_59730 [Rubripirellula lacrimiformis]